jgi:uncharacterized repeat protein (TIGR01451 family)
MTQQLYTSIDDGKEVVGKISTALYIGDNRTATIIGGVIYELNFNEDYGFSYKRVFNSVSSFKYLRLFDRNNDGRLDVVAFNTGDVGAYYFENRPEGLVLVEKWFSSVKSINFDDYNDDGRDEIILNGAIYYVDNEGKLERIVRNANINDYFYDPAFFLDFDKDGDKDIVFNLVTNAGYFEISEKDFIVPQIIMSLNHQVKWLRLVNHNNVQTMIYGKDSKFLSKLEFDTLSKNWQTTILSDEIPVNGYEPYYLDINEDGYDDIQLNANALGRTRTLLYNPNIDYFEETQVIDLGNNAKICHVLKDNKYELHVIEPNSLTIYEYNENAELVLKIQNADLEMVLFDNSFVDINGDGYLDQVNHLGHKRHYFGELSFDAISDYTLPEPGGQYLDYDIDGDADYIVEDRWYENEGDGVYGQAQVYPDFYSYPDPNIFFVNVIYEGDIDDDGDIDLLAYNNFGESLYLYENNNNIDFKESVELADNDVISGDLYYIDVLDLDGDGDKDIVMSAASAVIWIENSGGLNFEQGNILYDGVYRPYSVKVEDGDSDGYPDIAIGSGAIITGAVFGEVLLFSGTESGPQLAYNSGQRAGNYQKVFFIDADFQGAKDLLVSGADLSVLRFESYLESPQPYLKIAEKQEGGIAVKDVDNDDDDDIILYNSGSAPFKYLLRGFEHNNLLCPPGNVNIRTQSEVDDFGTRYGSCKVMNHSIILGGESYWSNIEDISPLFNLEEIKGDLRVKYINMVDEYTFPHLKSIGGAFSWDIIKMPSDVGFDSLETIGSVYINNMQFLFGTQKTFENLPSFKENKGGVTIKYTDLNTLSPFITSDTLHGDLIVDDLYSFNYEFDIADIERLKRIDGILQISGDHDFLHDENTFANLEYVESFEYYPKYTKKINLNLKNTIIENFRVKAITNFPTNKINIVNNDLAIASDTIQGWVELGFVGRNMTLSGSNIGNDISFKQLTEVGDNLFINGDTGKADFTNFSSLSRTNRLQIYNQNQNTTLHGFENVDTISSNFTIYGCDQLVDLSHISDDIYIGTSLSLLNNPVLNVCDYPFICSHIEEGRPYEIDNNGPGCEDISRIRCLENSASGYVFYDYNKDGIWQENIEARLSNMEITTIANFVETSIITDHTGFYQRFLAEGDDLKVTLDLPQGYNNTTPTEISIDSFYSGILPESAYNFGIVKENAPLSIMSDISTSIFVCNRPFYLNAITQNTSSEPINGVFKIYYQEGIELDSDFTAYEEHDEEANIITFSIENLYPYQVTKFNIPFIAPSADFLNVPLLIKMNSNITGIESNEMIAEEANFELELLCSFDPNDKLVKSSNGSANIRFGYDDELIYTIRFQNTGNYFAEDVIITDVISEDLDLGSFNFIDASHAVEIAINERTVSFIFEDINLIDSTSNFLESQGFVTFRINPINKEIGHSYHNDADIFFDFNEAIETNITESIVYNPSNTYDWAVADNVILYPIPAKNNVILACDLGGLSNYSIYNSIGSLVLNGEVLPFGKIDITRLNGGIYTILLKMEDGRMYRKKLIVAE